MTHTRDAGPSNSVPTPDTAVMGCGIVQVAIVRDPSLGGYMRRRTFITLARQRGSRVAVRCPRAAEQVRRIGVLMNLGGPLC